MCAIEGALIMPFFFWHLYGVTHRDKRDKKTRRDSSEEAVDVEKLLKHSTHHSSEFNWNARDSSVVGS